MTNITALLQISKRVLPTGRTERRPYNALCIMRQAPIARPARFRPTFRRHIGRGERAVPGSSACLGSGVFRDR